MSKNGQKTVIFAPKIMFCKILAKILRKNCRTIQGHYLDPKTTPNRKRRKKPIKIVRLAVKTKVLRGFSGFEPRNGAKTEKLAKTDVDIGRQKVLHGQTRLDEASLAMPYTVKFGQSGCCYSQIRKFDCIGHPITQFDRMMDWFWILACLTQTNPNQNLGFVRVIQSVFAKKNRFWPISRQIGKKRSPYSRHTDLVAKIRESDLPPNITPRYLRKIFLKWPAYRVCRLIMVFPQKNQEKQKNMCFRIENLCLKIRTTKMHKSDSPQKTTYITQTFYFFSIDLYSTNYLNIG